MGEPARRREDPIDAFARANAPEVLERARREAIERATAVLTEELTRSILGEAHALQSEPAPRTPKRTSRPPKGTSPPRPAQPARAPEAPPAERAPQEDGDALWVYGVARAGNQRLAEAIHETGGAAVGGDPALLDHGGLAAIVSEVPLAEFGEEQLRENLNDVEWLEAVARAHENVLDAALAAGTIVPLRLCTIYRSPAQVREMLDRERSVFEESLTHLEGRAEWGVKLIAEPGALEDAVAGEAPATGDDVSAGVAYLQGRGREAKAREEADRVAGAWAEEAHAALAALAEEALCNPLQNPEVSGHTGEMLLNGVYLVDEDSLPAFLRQADRLSADFAERSASVELTGPWPPYNFVRGSIEAAR